MEGAAGRNLKTEASTSQSHLSRASLSAHVSQVCWVVPPSLPLDPACPALAILPASSPASEPHLSTATTRHLRRSRLFDFSSSLALTCRQGLRHQPTRRQSCIQGYLPISKHPRRSSSSSSSCSRCSRLTARRERKRKQSAARLCTSQATYIVYLLKAGGKVKLRVMAE